MELEHLIGKKCKIRLDDGHGNDLFYTAIIKEVSDTHISFTDRGNLFFIFKLNDIQEIREIREVHK